MNNTRKINVETVLRNKFYKLPQLFFGETIYKNMSNNAKILYSILANRHDLSLENGWIDKENNVYFIFKQEELMYLMNVSNKTIVKYMRELEEFKLIKREKQGLNKADILYLLDLEITEKQENTRMCKKYTSGSEQSTHPGCVKSTLPEVKKVHTNKTNINKTNINKTKLTRGRGRNTNFQNENSSNEILINTYTDLKLTKTQINIINSWDIKLLGEAIEIFKGAEGQKFNYLKKVYNGLIL